MRILIPILMAIVLVNVALALGECQRIMEPSDIPCNIISSWHPSETTSGAVCEDYNMSVYNSSGIVIQTLPWGNYTPYCNVTFNQSAMDTYHTNSTLEDNIITVRGTKMWILALLLIPLGLCFFFVYLANTLDDVHNPLKWFFRMIALIMIFIIYQGAHTITQLNPGYESLAEMFSITVYGWIFWVIMGYLLIYVIYNLFMSFKHKKEWDWNEEYMK